MMAKKKAQKRKPGKISQIELLRQIIKATRRGEAIYEFFPGSTKMDFIHLYCDGLTKPGGTRKKGWVATQAGIKRLR